MEPHKFTREEVLEHWHAHLTYFVAILNGECTVEESRDDLLSLINHKDEIHN